MVEHVVERVRQLADEVIVVVRKDQPQDIWPASHVVCDDPGLSAGPLRGLISGLRACRSAWAWVMGCDTPCLQPGLLLALREAAGPKDQAVVPVWNDALQPLVACYATAAAEMLAEAARTGVRSVRGALMHVHCRILLEEEWRGHDPRGLSFRNVNTPADLVTLTRELDG
jgi:molybdopterin-guanine dinucleotide biosynthesis protein A